MLLPTKLVASRSPGVLVARPRLVARIEDHLSRRLTWISAPAGSGKSTLLGQWIRTTKARTAWLSLEGADNDPRRFGAYVIAALSSIHPELSAQAEDLLTSRGAFDLISLFTQAVVLPFAKTSREHAALVLDDYHLIERPSIHEAIERLIEMLPPSLHLLIASRSAPPFSVARWRVRRELLEIGPIDLRFSLDEATAFYNDVMSLSLPPSEVAAIEERTEGWAAALQLSALSLKGGTDSRALLRALSGEHRLIGEYLAEEVLDQQPDDRRRFLLRTSILERMNAALCEAVTGEPGAQEQLRALESGNLFLLPLDESGQWFRYHHLFAEVLKNRLTADDLRMLHERAAEWFAANRRFDEAVRHLMAVGPSELAEEKIETWGESLLRVGEIDLLREWTRSFPADARSPFIGVLGAWASVLTGRAGDAERWAVRAEQAAASRSIEAQAKVAQHLAASRAFAAQNLGNFTRSVALSEAALQGPLRPEVKAALQLNAGQSLRRLGEYERASVMLQAAVRGGTETGHMYLAFGALFHLAASQRVQGRLQVALRTLEELAALRERQRRGGHFAVGGESEQAYIYWLQGDQAQALLFVRRTLEAFGLVSEPWDFVYGRWIVARVLIAVGELDEAAAVLDETRLPAEPHESSPVEQAVLTAQAELALARGDPVAAREMLPGTAPADVESMFDRRWVEARIALALGETDTAAAAAALEEAEKSGRLMHACAWAALLAFVRKDAASSARARQLAARTGIERWSMMFDRAAVAPHVVHAGPAESLTQRELEVLGLVAEGLSNQDAASRLYVSVGTVKTHVHKILEKLASNNRTEAVHKARSLGLIR